MGTARKLIYFDIILAGFAVLILLSNIAATKLVAIGPLIFDGGAILFPLVYVFGDVITEVYGYKAARRAIYVGIFASVLASLTFLAVQHLPSAAEYTNQAAFESVLGFVPNIVLASLAGLFAGQFINAFVMAKLKIRTKGKKLWLRLGASTLAGELIDTTIFCVIAFYGILSGGSLLNYILVGVCYKVLVEFAVMPITYKLVRVLKKRENLEVYDKKTDFNPFHFEK
ncbi:MAG TPA: queuosine precursor transporter [Candidatus Saccharimonadales bacterium]